MWEAFPENYKDIADSMGIALYQRFDLNEASLFLRCPTSDVTKLIDSGKLAGIRVTDTDVQMFGYQLLEYLLENVTRQANPSSRDNDHPDRIMRAKGAVEMTGLSRTTIWRMEKSGQFPNRVSLGVGSVGWMESEVRSEKLVVQQDKTVIDDSYRSHIELVTIGKSPPFCVSLMDGPDRVWFRPSYKVLSSLPEEKIDETERTRFDAARLLNMIHL